MEAMELTELAKPPVAALPLAGFRAQLRLGSGFASDGVQDGLLEACLRAGMAAVERRTGRVLLARDFSLAVTGWAAPARQPLPLAPVRAVNGVDLVDAQGQTVAADGWWLRADDQAPALEARGVALPAIPAGGRAVIRFRAGLAESWAALPDDLARAVMMLAAHYYDHRGALGEGAMPRPLPEGVAALLAPWRRLSLGGGR